MSPLSRSESGVMPHVIRPNLFSDVFGPLAMAAETCPSVWFVQGFFSRPSPKAGLELQTVSNTRRRMTLSEKSARAGHWAVSLHRGCVLVFLLFFLCL